MSAKPKVLKPKISPIDAILIAAEHFKFPTVAHEGDCLGIIISKKIEPDGSEKIVEWKTSDDPSKFWEELVFLHWAKGYEAATSL